MPRHVSGTPCPMPPSGSNADNSILSLVDGEGDSTANIEFTSAFGGLKNTKPRRMRNAATARRGAQNVDFAIYEDAEAVQKSIAKEPAKWKSTVGLSQPPQRPKISARVSFAPSVSMQSHDSTRPSSKSLGVGKLTQAPRRGQGIGHDTENRDATLLPSLPEDTTANLNMSMPSPTILKPARRGTIYIPNDDTTMPSMYMGIFSPIKSLNVDSTSKPADTHTAMEVTGIAAQMAKKRGATRRSMIALSPKRAGGPLHVSSRYVQESAVVEDRVGQGGGKENVPPGYAESNSLAGVKFEKEKMRSKRQTMAFPPTRNTVKRDFKPTTSRLYEQTASSMSRVVEKQSGHGSEPKRSWNSGARIRTAQPIPVKKSSPPRGSEREKAVPAKPAVPTRFVTPAIRAEPAVDSYPILTEDLASPSMYEDNWLNHQEIAITQLVNNLFASSSLTSCPVEDGMLRVQLLERYNNSETTMLFKRLQGALLYGALAMPNDVLKGASRLATDLGRRKAFTDLWLETYEPDSLRAVLEVVVGRQCTTVSPRLSASRRSLDKEKDVLGRQSLQRFIETFLIRNEDGKPDEASSKTHDSPWSYQRTLLRSLMAIGLLDHIKSTAPSLVNGCLFRTTSPHKSSGDVVKALFQQLNPSAGDPIRALSHVGYSVSHSQYPLEEYAYTIDNLAVDLRDGVRLTRLVELLLYPSASHVLDHASDFESTTTILLPTGETLSLSDGLSHDWPLSQHLKFPSPGRATKQYNVQIALSALQGVRGMAPLVRDVRAEDIVDGFREKTVKLLWGLTSKWGLCGLLDWDDLGREIKRLSRLSSQSGRAGDDFCDDILDAIEEEDGHDPVRYKMLLKAWAQAVARKHGLVVKNLTTSFADGKVFEAIVDEYEAFLIPSESGADGGMATATTRSSLKERLRRLGCSDQFSSLFSAGLSDAASSSSSSSTHIFDRDFVLAALAFLCSRLLTPSRGVRAAMTVQKAWRARWAKVVESRKARLKIIAEQCAAVVGDKTSSHDHGDSRGANGDGEGGRRQMTRIPEPSVKVVEMANSGGGGGGDDDEDIWLNL